MVYTKPNISPVEWHTNSFRIFDIQTDNFISTRRADHIIINKKWELAKLWTLLSWLTTVKLKENEKKDKSLNLTRELKKLRNMKVTFMPIVIGAFGTVIKGLIKGLEDLEIAGQVETIQTTALLRSARILRRVLETCCHSDSSERLSANTDVKNKKKENLQNCQLCCPSWPQNKTERMWKEG